ncbi:uncharacterized protein LOC62_07G008924 [Vanrija pseudolonga]|uniref:Uncharacterized protein n=1 Tax=Vanrija pseudolonga TaxID=143232 RepID=A0AAF1BR14_9TREE|nr:hypothetical protein LOC62_07G008924 [Vanrija pseudolonga]
MAASPASTSSTPSPTRSSPPPAPPKQRTSRKAVLEVFRERARRKFLVECRDQVDSHVMRPLATHPRPRVNTSRTGPSSRCMLVREAPQQAMHPQDMPVDEAGGSAGGRPLVPAGHPADDCSVPPRRLLTGS